MSNSAIIRYRASRAFVLLAAGFALLFGLLVALLARDQQLVLEATERLQQQTVPEIIRYQRLARNLEQLRQEGERIFAANSPEARQQAVFVVTLVASHPSVIEHPQSAALARETERFLVDINRQANENPVTLKDKYQDWVALAGRLSLQVDDVAMQGVNLTVADLGNVARLMQTARVKLIGALVLVAAFLLLLGYLLRQYLIRPLQKIDRQLSDLSLDRPEPEYPVTPIAEIFSIEEASKRFHASLVENELARHELEKLAHRDGLTGLINRRYFMLRAESELLRAHRYERSVTVGMADLDFFKRINDTYGHAAGDVVLKTFAQMLLDSVRQTDLVCRYGGEEFAFVFPESTVDEARMLAERFRQRFAEYDIRLPDGGLVRVTLSIGLADASRCLLEEALRHADDALYEAKHQGRNRVIVA
ncbi:MAG: GGDEF domain-containing protein [Azonexus sp.]